MRTYAAIGLALLALQVTDLRCDAPGGGIIKVGFGTKTPSAVSTGTTTAPPSDTPTLSDTATSTPTSTPSVTRTRTATRTATLTASATATSTGTAVPTPVAAADCLTAPLLVASHPNPQNQTHVDRMFVTPDDAGWGLFWAVHGDLWNVNLLTDVWYAHVSLSGVLDVAPRTVLRVRRHDRVNVYHPVWVPWLSRYSVLVTEFLAFDNLNRATSDLWHYAMLPNGTLTGTSWMLRTDLGWSGSPDALRVGYDRTEKRDVVQAVVHHRCGGVHDCLALMRIDPANGRQVGFDSDLTGTQGSHILAAAWAGDALVANRDYCVQGLSGQVVRWMGFWGSSMLPDKVLQAYCAGYWPAETAAASDGAGNYAALWRTKGSGIEFARFKRGPSDSVVVLDRRTLMPEPPAGTWYPGDTNDLQSLPDGGWLATYLSGSPTTPDVTLDRLGPDGELVARRAEWMTDDRSLSAATHFADPTRVGILSGRRQNDAADVWFREWRAECQ